MAYHIAGIFLIVVGCLFVLAALIKFCADIFQQMRPPETKRGFGADVGKWADLLTAFGKLPPFAMSAVIGIALVLLGGWITQGHTAVP